MKKMIGMFGTLFILCGIGISIYCYQGNEKSQAKQVNVTETALIGPVQKMAVIQDSSKEEHVAPAPQELMLDRETVTEAIPTDKERITFKNVTVTRKELNLLYQIVEAEATGGDKKSKRLVCAVILNRVHNKSFPNSIEKVILQKSGNTAQFSPVTDGRLWKVCPTDETKKAVKQVLDGKDESQGALFFANRKTAKNENMRWFDTYLQYLYSYGGHEYFCQK